MFSKIQYGTRFLIAALMLLVPLCGVVYGIVPHETWVRLLGESPILVTGFAKNCVATGSCAAILLLLGLLNPRFFKSGSFMILGLVFSMIGVWFMYMW